MELAGGLDWFLKGLVRENPFLSLWTLRESAEEYIRRWNADHGSRVKIDKEILLVSCAEEAFDLRVHKLRNNLFNTIFALATAGWLVFWLRRLDPADTFNGKPLQLLWEIPVGLLAMAFVSAMLGLIVEVAAIAVIRRGGQWVLERLGRPEEGRCWGQLWGS
jgi:hypothetical protein